MNYTCNGAGNNILDEYGVNGQPLAEFYNGANGIIAQQMFGLHNRIQDSYLGHIQTKGGLEYYEYDGLGNVMDITDRTGSQTMAYRYDAYGNLFTQMAAPYNDLGYTGEMYDAKAGLLDLSARWYNPGTGDFTSQDTYAGNQMDPMSLNRYVYTEDNPVNRVDPTGHKAAAMTGGGGSGSSGSRDDLPANSANNPLLVWGSQGDYVRLLQNDLNTLINAGLHVDGAFGHYTYEAVRAFQTRYHLKYIDGKVGPETWGKITELMSPKSSGGSGGRSGGSSGSGLTIEQKRERARIKFNQLAGTMPVIGYGSRGSAVVALQSYLNEAGGFNLSTDGIFGKNTRAAYDSYMAKNSDVNHHDPYTVFEMQFSMTPQQMGVGKGSWKDFGMALGVGGALTAAAVTAEFWAPAIYVVSGGSVAAVAAKAARLRRLLSKLNKESEAASVGGMGNLTGSLNGLTADERTVVNELVSQGNDVEIVPRSNVQTPDFKVNGVLTELKTLKGSSLNTAVTRIQDAFGQGARQVIIDARQTGMTEVQAQQVLKRAAGSYGKGGLPGTVQMWTQSGIVK